MTRVSKLLKLNVYLKSSESWSKIWPSSFHLPRWNPKVHHFAGTSQSRGAPQVDSQHVAGRQRTRGLHSWGWPNITRWAKYKDSGNRGNPLGYSGTAVVYFCWFNVMKSYYCRTDEPCFFHGTLAMASVSLSRWPFSKGMPIVADWYFGKLSAVTPWVSFGSKRALLAFPVPETLGSQGSGCDQLRQITKMDQHGNYRFSMKQWIVNLGATWINHFPFAGLEPQFTFWMSTPLKHILSREICRTWPLTCSHLWTTSDTSGQIRRIWPELTGSVLLSWSLCCSSMMMLEWCWSVPSGNPTYEWRTKLFTTCWSPIGCEGLYMWK